MQETVLAASQQPVPPSSLLEGPHRVGYSLSGQVPQGGGSPQHRGVGTTAVTSLSWPLTVRHRLVTQF